LSGLTGREKNLESGEEKERKGSTIDGILPVGQASICSFTNVIFT
jgi:hypothetical protein